MSYDQAAVNNLVSGVTSLCQRIGIFRSVNFHEPKSAPVGGLMLAIWADAIEPIAAASGLSSASGYVVLMCRAYGTMMAKPEDDVDPRLMSAGSALINAFCTDFTLGGRVRNIDLLGEYGRKLSAQAGHLTIDNKMYRIIDVTLPCIINDMWSEVP